METFLVAQSVTRDCSESIPKDQLTLGDIDSCVWDIGNGVTAFVPGSACTLDGEQLGFACYNNPSEGNYIFRS